MKRTNYITFAIIFGEGMSDSFGVSYWKNSEKVEFVCSFQRKALPLQPDNKMNDYGRLS